MLRFGLLKTAVQLWKHSNWTRERMIEFQETRLRAVVRHAYRNVLFHRSRFDAAGVGPEDIRGIADLPKIPTMDKNDLRQWPVEDTIAAGYDPNRLIKMATSGSTGQPFTIHRAPLENHVIHLFRVRAWHEIGRKIRDRSAGVLLGPVQGEKRPQAWLKRLKWAFGLYRLETVSCCQPPEDICRQLEHIDPDTIGGYPSVMERVAWAARGRFDPNKLKYVECGGESLSTSKRRVIEDGFGVPVYDFIGAHECNLVAWECKKASRLHVCDDNIILEVLRDGMPVDEGETGEVFLTTLHSYAMPFIRYRLGDMATKGGDRCPCGKVFSTLLEFKGRVREYFRLPDGRTVHPLEVVLPVFAEKPSWLDQYQMVQETRTKFFLRISTLSVPDPAELSRLKDKIESRLGKGAEFRIEQVENIPLEPSGKFKDCLCLLDEENGLDLSPSGE